MLTTLIKRHSAIAVLQAARGECAQFAPRALT